MWAVSALRRDGGLSAHCSTVSYNTGGTEQRDTEAEELDSGVKRRIDGSVSRGCGPCRAYCSAVSQEFPFVRAHNVKQKKWVCSPPGLLKEMKTTGVCHWSYRLKTRPTY